MKLYKTYLFRDKDPVIDILRTLIQKDGLQFKEIAEASGVSAGTLSKWFYGEVRRPQHATVMAVTRAMGYEYTFIKRNGDNIVQLPVAKVRHARQRPL